MLSECMSACKFLDIKTLVIHVYIFMNNLCLLHIYNMKPLLKTGMSFLS